MNENPDASTEKKPDTPSVTNPDTSSEETKPKPEEKMCIRDRTWEFYAITLSLYLVLAYPGFVYRYLFKRHPRLRT